MIGMVNRSEIDIGLGEFHVDILYLYGWHGSQYMCHAAEVCTGRFCLRLLLEHSSQLLITQLLEHSSQLLIGPAHGGSDGSQNVHSAKLSEVSFFCAGQTLHH